MPTLDFSDVILSLEFNDTFSVIRRTESVSEVTGRSTITEVQTDGLIGIVTFGAGGNRRVEEAQDASRTLNVTSFPGGALR